MLETVPKRRGPLKEGAPENFRGGPLSLWLNQNLCIHEMKPHKTGLYGEQFPELTPGWKSFEFPPARVKSPYRIHGVFRKEPRVYT